MLHFPLCLDTLDTVASFIDMTLNMVFYLTQPIVVKYKHSDTT